MIKLTEYELKLIARNRGIKNFQDMTEEKLLDAILKYDRITKNFLENRPKQIEKMENLS